MSEIKTEILIIGASSAGLSCAAYFQKNNIPYVLLEQSNAVGYKWRNYYDRLHLHTPRSISSLPFYKIPKSFGRYISRKKVVEYFEDYIKELNIQPVYNTKVTDVKRENDTWSVTTDNGSYIAEHVIIATGNTRFPKEITKKGLETFTGTAIHSMEYKNGSPYKDKNVLVVGFGNSACEIAICLTEHGAKASLSVRSAVNVLPRDVFGLSTLKMGISTNFLPDRLVDSLNQPFINMVVGDITKLGLKKAPYGIKEQISKTGKIPLLDIGTVDLIKKGKIVVHGDINTISGSEITFEDGKKDNFDAIIFATGHHHGLEKLVKNISDERLTDIKKHISKRKLVGKDNIYFAGFHVSLSGMLRECGIEAKYIYKHITSS